MAPPRAAHPTGSAIMVLGGFGFLSRLHGLSIDNLVEVEMVLADGKIVIVNEDEHPGVFKMAPSGGSRFLTQTFGPRSLVGNQGCWPMLRCCYQIHRKGVPCPCSICRKPSLVRDSSCPTTDKTDHPCYQQPVPQSDRPFVDQAFP